MLSFSRIATSSINKGDQYGQNPKDLHKRAFACKEILNKAMLIKLTAKFQVQDKSYFMGILRTKITELGTEISRLSGEIDFMKQEQSTFLTYDKRVKEMAQELTGKKRT